MNLTFQKVAASLINADYKFAKTMPEHPHFYTLKEKWTSDIPFEEVVKFMRENSTTEQFKGQNYQMFYLNQYKYWTMGAPLDQTILINRAKNVFTNEYDNIAEDYDAMFTDESSEKEERDLFSLLDVSGEVLDVGCGNGMLLKNVIISPSMYIGLDPSNEMLNLLKKHYPAYSNRVFNCPFEHFHSTGKYDTILALFGTASYISREAISRIKHLLTPSGKAYLMFYRDGYFPVSHKETNLWMDWIRYPGANYSRFGWGNVKQEVFTNYDLITITN